MVSYFLAFQIIAVVFVLCEVVYVAFQTPSKLQSVFMIMGIALILMEYGYLAEIRANSIDAALTAASFSYIGKTFALLCTLIFTLTYCGVKVKKKVIVLLSMLNWIFPVLVITNEYHNLYYSNISYDRSNAFNPLNVQHGPIYYVYVAYMAIVFIVMFVVLLREFIKTKSKQERRPILIVFGMVFSFVVGYILYAAKLTGGYDSTMAGAFVSSLFVTLLFFKYRLLDTLVLAKEKSVDNASCGILVFDNRGNEMYKNEEMSLILSKDFTQSELSSLEDRREILTKNENVYEVTVSTVLNKGRRCGKVVELTDITAKQEYSRKLEKEVLERTKKISDIQRSVVVSFANVIEARDSSTGKHVKKISSYVGILAKELRKEGKYVDVLTDDFIECAVNVAPLHDVGKICIPDEILLKPGKLTPDEFDVIKQHTVKGVYVIEECIGSVEEKDYYNTAKEVALYHHERWDGTGYPNRLKGEEIPLAARITSVADVYDALVSERCYKHAIDPESAKNIIIEGRGTQFCPDVVDAFIQAFDEILTI